PVTVRVEDGRGGSDVESFVLNVVVTPPGTALGAVFNDPDADGVRAPAEAGLGGRVAYVDANRDGRRQPGEQFSTTAADGTYALRNLAPGTYRVSLESMTGWRWTAPA